MTGRQRVKLLLSGIVAALFVVGLSPVGAASANISHSYSSNAPISNGSLVSLDPAQSNYVDVATTANGDQLLGVAVAPSDSLLAVDPGSGNVQVATTGTATVLVSTLNGKINVGDQVAVSPFSGIGMKAGPNSRIIGLAQTSFDASTQDANKRVITDKQGKKSTIYVGYTRLSIGIGTASSSVGKQNSLQRFVQSVSGRSISTIRIIVSALILLIAVVALVSLIYSSIYGSIVSIGRNPLAKFAIFRTLGSILGMVLATALIASVTIFFLLR